MLYSWFILRKQIKLIGLGSGQGHMIKLHLKKNLKREILRGHQWVYDDALEPVKKNTDKAELALLKSDKKELAWGIYDPHSKLRFRVLHVGKNMISLEKKFLKALRVRQNFDFSQTNAFRLFNGEGDLLPGLICDVYDSVAVMQFDGLGPEEFWTDQNVESWILSQIPQVKSVYFKPRKEGKMIYLTGETLEEKKVSFLENGVLFETDLVKGQKTGFFLDQRDNRHYIRQISKGKSVVNLFSYTGGFSVYAGLGGASSVESVDISKGAIETCTRNWELNKLPSALHSGVAEDVFSYLDKATEKNDMVIVDPPSMTSTKDSKSVAVKKYIDLFSKASRRVKEGGDLVVSSCSSRISFDDFDSILREALSLSKRKGQVLRVSGQGFDHPYPHNQLELRYLKFVHLVLD